MVNKNIYVVAYDVPNNKRRLKIAKLLQKYGGTRKNKSVFECFITLNHFRRMKTELNELLKPKRDTVLVYPVCRECYQKAEFTGLPGIKPTVIKV